jgi:hypothetical protein
MQSAEGEVSDRPIAESGVILPCQYYGATAVGALAGERRLMLGVLVDAINIIQTRDPMAGARRRQPFGEAFAWIMTEGTGQLFAFESVCDALNIDPEWLRDQLRGVVRRHGSPALERKTRLRIHGSSRMRQMRVNRVREDC